MKLSAANQKKYPKFTHYVKHELPKVKHTPRIVNALRKYGEIKKGSLSSILSWGTKPTINIVAMPKNQCGAFTPNSKSNEVRISKWLVQRFEKNSNKKPVIRLVEATILHELAHWGDDQDGKDIPGEEGNLFEKAAYGRVIACR